MAEEPRIKIVVVNHDAVFLGLMRRILESDGYEAIICPDGTAAHETILTTQPEIILLDTWLEVRESGWTLLQTLRLDDNTKHIPIVLCTSDLEALNSRASQVERMGNIQMLPKPFDPESLLQAVRETLDGRAPAASSRDGASHTSGCR
jgi:DNA-binding response OmpR family regulator